MFRLPLLYAVVAAVLVRALGWVPTADGTAMETIGLVGDAFPVMLLILGLQLADTDATAVTRSVTPSLLKLGAAPLVGVGLALGFEDPTVARVFVLECATPAAVIPLALTIEYADGVTVDGFTAPEYLSTVVFTTTVASVAVLTLVLAALEAGFVF